MALTSCTSSSLDKASENMNVNSPRTISSLTFKGPKISMQRNVIEALTIAIVIDLIMKYIRCIHVESSSAFITAFFPMSRSERVVASSMCCNNVFA